MCKTETKIQYSHVKTSCAEMHTIPINNVQNTQIISIYALRNVSCFTASIFHEPLKLLSGVTRRALVVESRQNP